MKSCLEPVYKRERMPTYQKYKRHIYVKDTYVKDHIILYNFSIPHICIIYNSFTHVTCDFCLRKLS